MLTGSVWGTTNTFIGAAGYTFTGANSDIYKFGAGATAVTINPSGNENADTIAFDSSIDATDVTLQAGGADGDDLVITDTKDNVSITVRTIFPATMAATAKWARSPLPTAPACRWLATMV